MQFAKRMGNARPQNISALRIQGIKMKTIRPLNQFAKTLQTALAAMGFNASHAQSLELVARMMGARTLHVEQAKPAVSAAQQLQAAVARATAVAFDSLGAYEGKVFELLSRLESSFKKESSRDIEAAVHQLMGPASGVKLSPLMDNLMLKDVPNAFSDLVERLVRAEAPAKHPLDHVIFQGKAQDWRVKEGVELPKAHETVYDMKISHDNGQVVVEMVPEGEDPNTETPGAHLVAFIEVNHGVPSLTFANNNGADSLASVFFTKDGVLLQPMVTDKFIEVGLVPEGTELQTLAKSMEQFHGTPIREEHFIRS
ncbi:hypothetical protein LC612_39645 [Nostoc sp. CHAB 5834]|nr:hypothetical protein [Nostoc sp. CHAB 5834]